MKHFDNECQMDENLSSLSSSKYVVAIHVGKCKVRPIRTRLMMHDWDDANSLAGLTVPIDVGITGNKQNNMVNQLKKGVLYLR